MPSLRTVFSDVGAATREQAGDGRYGRVLLVLLTLALALDYADRSALGALGPDLEHAFSLGNTRFGVLASAYSVVGALATLPAGVAVDRFRRTRVLALATLVWSAAMALTGLAVAYLMLLAGRLLLGTISAAARPAIASAVGDVYERGARARVLSVVDGGELVGNGIGFLVAGIVAALLGWRSVFFLLAAMGMGLAYGLRRLREPPRLPETDEGDEDAASAAAGDAEPEHDLVLEGDQSRMPVRRAFAYVIRVRTNVIVIVAAALSYFFFSGVRTFGVIFMTRAYGLGRSEADLVLLVIGVGALVGVVVGGRVADRLARAGRANARLLVASASYTVAVLAFAPVLLLHSLAIGLPFAVVGGAALVAPSPPLDAVRLDVVHPQLRGRAEGVRTTLQIAAEAAAPIGFGLLSDTIAGGGAAGMRAAFLISLGAVLVAAAVLLLARRTYPREAAAVEASGP